ncbi:hypothetical protein Trydic_g8482 [Trypoxylus dichotomus]
MTAPRASKISDRSCSKSCLLGALYALTSLTGPAAMLTVMASMLLRSSARSAYGGLDQDGCASSASAFSIGLMHPEIPERESVAGSEVRFTDQ